MNSFTATDTKQEMETIPGAENVNAEETHQDIVTEEGLTDIPPAGN